MASNTTDFKYGQHVFGPAMPDQFDFTSLFENYFFSIVPSAILFLVLPFRLRSLQNRSKKVSRSLLHSNKLVFLAIFTAFQAAVLVLYAVNLTVRDSTTLVAASLVFADALGLCFLSHAEHVRTLTPSTIINSYLFVTLLFDVARTRTLWIQSAPKPLTAVFTATTVVKFGIAVIESIEKRGILLFQYQHSSPEATSGIYNRSFFWWLNGIMRLGFRQVIKLSDLFAMSYEMSSNVLSKRAQASWDNGNQIRSNALFWSTLKATRYHMALCVFPRLCIIGFRFAQPFILSRTVNFVNSTDSNNIGWGLTAAFGIVLAGKAVATGSYYHMTYRFITSIRGSLVGIIYTKTVNLSVIALDESAAVTLMSNDAEVICQAFQNIHEIWAVPIELAFAAWLLQRQLGVVFLAPMAVACVSTLCILWLSRFFGGAQKIWNEGIQTRIDATKMLGFVDKLTELLQGLRIKELQLAGLFRRLLVASEFFTNSMTITAPMVTFVVFVLVARSTGEQLTTAQAYTTLSLLALLANPIALLLRAVPTLNSALSSFNRIQSFLETDSLQRHILPLNPRPNSDLTDATPEHLGFESGGDIELKNRGSKDGSNSTAMDVRNASFSWSYEAAPVVHDVSFSIRRGDFTFIVGPVGCGKSTLLKGLMSETPSSKGFVYSNCPEVAFVDQTPWVQNITIRRNILGQSIFDEPRYNEVIRACALDQDIASMPNTDDTIVGSQGISLSGGQKQRLTLARAIYAKKELIIIDDAFSGLDAETEETVFVKILGKQGLLKHLNATVVLVTHAIHRAPYADHIIALDSSGHISEQGNFEELIQAGGYVQSLAVNHKFDNGTVALDLEDLSAEPRDEITATASASNDDSVPLNGELSTYKYYFASIGWSRSCLSFGLAISSIVLTKSTELLLTYWTGSVAEHGNEVNTFYVGIYGLLSGLATILFTCGCYHFFLSVVPTSAETLHARLLRAVMSAPLHFFTSTDTGTTTNRFSQDMTIVDAELPFALIDLVTSMAQTVMSAILMCLSAGYFTLTMPPVIFVVWVIQKFYLRTSRQVRILDLEAKSPLYSHFIESLSGLVTIRAFGWREDFIEQNLVLLDNSQKPYYLLWCIQRWLGLVLDLMVSGLAVILMVLVVKLRDSIGAGHVGLALLNVIGFGESLVLNVRQWTALETSIGAIGRLKTFEEITPNENLPCETQPVAGDWPANGKVELKDLSASFTQFGKPILQHINMTIQPGEKIGICGRSGSGKSSLIMTLFRMLEIAPESSILIDGVDITKIPRQAVRSRLNAIPQDPFFMKGSIRLNASPENLHSDEDISQALQKLQLWDIVESKGGLDAELHAEFFSHGQRQLFCLARAILRKSRIVVLDEVSSSVDITTDILMQRVIREEFAGSTIIAIAHRLDTILDFDKVAVLSEGQLVEFDSPQVLLEQPSAFRELYNS
ncbi:putative multidrug resistance-associated protein [Amylocarpus encephaloides]|uniref:Multidrug resistance-associated protein n=1 Tax=Amylocarpus encephaloides TaxID=45428 RepID=A0A9P7YES2_9HELO|nr:putative multidrug resistance-associated protein [Amylocarpus encephaloides]